MAEYTNADLLNEVSKLFRAGINPGVEGGTLNTQTEYNQLLELASTTFLFSTDSVFYLAKMARNRLNSITNEEVRILEDIMVLLEDLGKIGSPIRDETTLNNARTTILSLDAASSVSDRPETERFIRQMDIFAAKVKKNVVSRERGNIMVRPREEARTVIQKNLQTLTAVHARLLSQTTALKDVLTSFLSLDIPSRVSSSVLASISQRLKDASDQVADSTDTENLEGSRDLFLQTLANKVAVKLLGTFKDPSEFKFRGPTRPIPSTMKHYGRVVGTGTPASVLTGPAPWKFPVSGSLDISVSGGSPSSLDLAGIIGSFIAGRAPESFPITTDNKYLHVCVDPSTYDGTALGTSTATHIVTTLPELSFKHVGCPVFFPDSLVTAPSDFQGRFITDLYLLQYLLAGSWVPATSQVYCPTWGAGGQLAVGFTSDHVGGYIKDGAGNRFEILSVESSDYATIDPRGMTPSFGGSPTLYGNISNAVFDVLPALTNAPAAGHRVQVGPAVKTAELSLGVRSASAIVGDIEAETGPFPATNPGATLNWHLFPTTFNGKIALRIRSRVNPFAQITGRFLNIPDPVGSAGLVEASAHIVLGFYEGDTDDADTLSASELAGRIGSISGLVGEVVTTELLIGNSAQTSTAVSRIALVGEDVVEAGVQPGDQVELLSGPWAGLYHITSVISSEVVEVEEGAFPSKLENIPFRIFREQVKISLTDSGPGTSLEVTSSPSELGLPSGVVYSSIPQFEAVDKLGSKLQFKGVVPTDLLRVVGNPTEYVIEEVQDSTRLILETGVPSNVEHAGFEIKSAAAKSYEALNARLKTFVSSPNLLRKNKFDEGIDAISNAVTLAVLPGRNFLASRNQARRMVGDLLSILTTNYSRTNEYEYQIPNAADDLASILSGYEAPDVVAVDSFLDALRERKYDRAMELLQQGKVVEFFATNEETASYGGAVMSASRNVVNDLPRPSRTRAAILDQRDIATDRITTTDADFDYSDIDDEPEMPFE